MNTRVSINIEQDKPLRYQEQATSDYEVADPASDYETDYPQLTTKVLELENFAFIVNVDLSSRPYLYCSVQARVNNQPWSVDILWDWKSHDTVTLDESDYEGTDYYDIFAYFQRIGYALDSSQVLDFQSNLQAMVNEQRAAAGLPVGDE